MEEYLEKNKAICDLKDAMPSVLNGLKADAPALRRGIDEAREAQASVAELIPFIEALKKADPSLITEVDEAILKGKEQVDEAIVQGRTAQQPQDSYLLPEQFEALLEAVFRGALEPS